MLDDIKITLKSHFGVINVRNVVMDVMALLF